jgi:Sugar (and other) transporter
MRRAGRAGAAARRRTARRAWVIYHASTTFQSVGLGPAAAIGATTSICVVNPLTTFAAVLLLDWAGRSPLLLTGMALSLMLLGMAHDVVPPMQPHLPWFTIAGVMLFVEFFAFSLGPIFWLLTAEIIPVNVWGARMAIATLIQCVANLLVSATFLTMQKALTPRGGFWLLGLVCLCALALCYFFVPEPTGRSPEFIERVLCRSDTIRTRDSLHEEAERAAWAGWHSSWARRSPRRSRRWRCADPDK